MTEVATIERETAQTKETPIANVSTNLFRAAYICVSREETRYYLNGVYITPHPDGGALLIATDGHRMIVIRDDSAWCRESVIVQLDRHGLDACKPAPKRSSKPIVGARNVVDSLKKGPPDERRLIVQHDGTAEVEGVWRSPAKVLIDGTFPDWRRVCPFTAKWEQKPASFNSKYIGEFGQIAAILRGSSEPSTPVKIITDGPGDPALIHMGDITNAFGILMPMRGTERAGGFPTWMFPIQQAVEAEKAAALAAAAEEAKKKADEAAKALAASQPAKKPRPKPTKAKKAKKRVKARKRRR